MKKHKRNLISIITIVIIVLFAYSGLSGAKTVDYDLYKPEDVSYANVKRYSFRVVIKEKATPKQLKDVAREVVEIAKRRYIFNAISIYMYDYKEYINGTYTLARVEFAPYGKWGKAGAVETGEYDKMSFNWDIKEKDWSKQLSPKEAEIYGYFDNLLWNTSLEESTITRKTANKFDISKERVEEIYDKQTAWTYMDKEE